MKKLSVANKHRLKKTHNAVGKSTVKAKNEHKTTATSSVRIIGGQFKRRTVTFIDAEGLRPTPDRLRETLFNWLLTNLHEAYILDSCAGSGVLGFEALSRGAAHCVFIETNRVQWQMLEQSAQQLRLDNSSYRTIHGKAEQILNQSNDFHRPFDIVFIDPPYAQDLWQPILTALISSQLITTDTLIYLEADKDLSKQLNELISSFNMATARDGKIAFECLKQTKIGQVVAGLYRFTLS